MAYFGQTHGSYFDDSHNDQDRIMRDGILEQERQLKRQKQAAIAEELSMIASDEYREDHLDHMEAMEVNGPDLSAFHNRFADLVDSSKRYQMLPPSKYRQRSNGLCVPIFSTS